MGNLRFKVNDRVRVKSLEWYNDNKTESGNVKGGIPFIKEMTIYCNQVLTISEISGNGYHTRETGCQIYWNDDMFEGLVESELNEPQDNEQTFNAVDDVDCVKPVVFENIVFPNENYADKVELCLGDDYEIVVEDGRTFVQKKKPKYPNTYEECCKILGIDSGNFITIRNFYRINGEEIITDYEDTLNDKFKVLWKLLICRDAYWKIAGEEMGLGKSWEPDWTDNYQKKWLITFYQDEINFTSSTNVQFILAFPTKEMRDAFYENFKDLIEKCKELL